MSSTSVLTAPMIDPGMARQRIDLPTGLTVAEMVDQALPGYSGKPERLRVILVDERGSYLAPPALWAAMRPKPGVKVVIRVVPGKDVVRSVLLIVVSVVATVFAPTLAGVLLPGVNASVGTALVSAGLTILGQLLVNALIPVEQSQLVDSSGVDTYRIDGWRNERRPGAPVPLVAGKHRMAPPYAATPYTEVIGDDQYVRAVFCFGYGANRLSDHRIGNTPITDYQDIQIEVREGRPGDQPLALYPQQVIEEADGVDLVRPFPVDAAGNLQTGEPTIESPITRFTATNATEAAVLIGFSSGLFYANDNGSLRSQTVSIRIRQRLEGIGNWQDVETLNITNAKRETFLRRHAWTLPARGRWQIEVTRMTDATTNTRISDTATLAAIQSIRPEYPINLDKPLTLVAIRVRATHQLNGPLDSYNALVEKEGQVRAAGAWATGYGRNPATAFLEALTGPSNPFPASEASIDMDLIADWYDWCELKGLKYDRVHEEPIGLGELLRAICGAGRASPRHDGVRWGVVIDRPDTLVIDHINPRNSEQFQWSRSYFQPPDGFRVRFLDETNEYDEAEMIVPWPGHDGDVALTESLELPGKVDPAEVWRETKRRMHEAIYRSDSFSAMQSGAARVATRGDLVMGSFDVLDRTVAAARVLEVRGSLIVIDEDASIGAGYGARFKAYADQEDLVGVSTVVAIAPSETDTTALTVTGGTARPEVGSIIHIGPMATESMALKVRGVEGAQDFSSRVLMVAAAPEIDALTDAEVPPAWNGVVGDVAAITEGALLPPLFSQVTTILAEDGLYDLQINLRADNASILIPSGFEIDYRVVGQPTWTTLSIVSADGGTIVPDLARDTEIELQARALSGSNVSDPTQVVTITIGADDPTVPGALEDEGISVLGSLGHALVGIAIPSDSTATQVQIYRVPMGVTLNRTTHAIGNPVSVSNGSTITFADGDATRSNLLVGGGFGTSDGWTEGDGWLIEAGEASHAAGFSGQLSKPVPLEAGKTYRIAFDVATYVAGSVTPTLIGGTASLGAPVTAAGQALDRITSTTGNASIALDADAGFDGAIDDLIVFLETASCIDAGQWDYYVEPQNEQSIAGPLSGPFTVTVF